METIPGVFDGKSIILKDGSSILLENISKGGVEILPYLVFPVWTEKVDGNYLKSSMEMIYPHTANNEENKDNLPYGTSRPTRIFHYVPLEMKEVVRKPDLKTSRKVHLSGFKQITLDLKDGTKVTVSFEGNCYRKMKEVNTLVFGERTAVLEEFFDRPSMIIDILKRNGIEIYSK